MLFFFFPSSAWLYLLVTLPIQLSYNFTSICSTSPSPPSMDQRLRSTVHQRGTIIPCVSCDWCITYDSLLCNAVYFHSLCPTKLFLLVRMQWRYLPNKYLSRNIIFNNAVFLPVSIRKAGIIFLVDTVAFCHWILFLINNFDLKIKRLKVKMETNDILQNNFDFTNVF